MLRETQSDAAAEKSSETKAAAREATLKEPAETTNGLLYIFPFLCRQYLTETDWRSVVIEIPAETLLQAQFVIEQDPALKIVRACTGRAHPDCLRERQVFNLKQAAAYLGIAYDTMKKKCGADIVKSANGEPWFTRYRLNKWACAQGETPQS